MPKLARNEAGGLSRYRASSRQDQRAGTRRAPSRTPATSNSSLATFQVIALSFAAWSRPSNPLRHPRVDGVAQAVAEKVHGEHRQ